MMAALVSATPLVPAGAALDDEIAREFPVITRSGVCFQFHEKES